MIFAAALTAIIAGMWLLWGAIWAAAAFRTKPTRWRESFGSRASHVILLLAAAALLAERRWLPPALSEPFVPTGIVLPAVGAAMVAAGLGFAVWARAHLGRNWSGIITVKEGHTLVRTGPYRIVRHPIYTGLLLAVIGTAAAFGEWRGVLAVICVLVGFLRKIQVEERRMSENFPEHAQYRRDTAILIPWLY